VRSMFDMLRKQCESVINTEPDFYLSPDMVLLGILRFGQQHRNDSQYLAGRLSAIANRSDLELADLLSKEITYVLREGMLNPPHHDFEQEIKNLFKSAENITSRVGRQENIAQRHLIAALLSPARPNGIVGDRCRLFEKTLPASKFAAALVDYVTQSDRVRDLDQIDKWLSILRRFQSEISLDTERRGQQRKKRSGKTLEQAIDEAIASGAKPSPPSDSLKTTLADTEDILLGQIAELGQRLATEKKEDNRRQIISQIENKKFQLAIVLGEKGGQSPSAGIFLPETAMRLASEIQTLEQKEGNTTDQAERVQIKVELDRKHAELDVALGKKQNGDHPRAWDAEFRAWRRDSGFRWSTTLDGILDLLWEEHSRAFKESIGDTQRRFEPQISPRALFLAALYYNAKNTPPATIPSDGRGQTLNIVQHALGLSADRLSELLTKEFFRHLPPSKTSQDRAIISEELSAVIKRADAIRGSFGADQYIGTRHLLLALLEAAAGGRTGDKVIRSDDRIDRAQLIAAFRDSIEHNPWALRYDDRADWAKVFEELEAKLSEWNEGDDSRNGKTPMRVGGGMNFSREATGEEVCLQANEYARALADFFTASQDHGEMCFALFGHWGRGKSFLMNLTGNLLRPRHLTPPARRDQETSFFFGFRKVSYRVRLCIDAGRTFFAGHSGYEIIKFSAWKYPNIPEVWVHLYENFARLGYPKNVFQSIPRIFRAGISKRGLWQIFVALAVLVLSVCPKSDYGLSNIVSARAIDLALGVGSLVWLVALLSNVWTTARRLSKDFLTATHHHDKLGLQATIGEDLEALLHGWLPDACPKLCGWLFWAYASVCYLIAGFAWWRISGPNSGWFAIAAYGTIIVGGTALGAYLLFGCRGPQRVLLIVDDLDRCKPDQLLTVVESVKVLVETPEISRRIQVAMLIEEDVLEQAILKKYEGMRETNDEEEEKTTGLGWSNDRISRENMEKLFTAHLRLPPLADEELEEILSKLISRGGIPAIPNVPPSPVVVLVDPVVRGNPSSAPADPVPREESKSPGFVPSPGADVSTQGRSAMPPPAIPSGASPTKTLVKDLVFTENDEAALNAALPELVGACEDFHLGPRSVRAFAFRFQLARLLLRQLSVEPDPQRLAMGLARKASQGKKSGPPLASKSLLDRVIDQVA